MTKVIVTPGTPVGIVHAVQKLTVDVDPETAVETQRLETSQEACERLLPDQPEGSFIIDASRLPGDRDVRDAWRVKGAGLEENLKAARAIATAKGAGDVSGDDLDAIKAKLRAM